MALYTDTNNSINRADIFYHPLYLFSRIFFFFVVVVVVVGGGGGVGRGEGGGWLILGRICGRSFEVEEGIYGSMMLGRSGGLDWGAEREEGKELERLGGELAL